MFFAFSLTSFNEFMEQLKSPIDLIFSPAYAQSFSFFDRELMSFAPIVFVFILMYFLILRPQNKRAKQHRDMLASLRRGDRVLTAGGIIGTIHKIENQEEVSVEISENVRVRIVKATLSQVLAHPEPLKVSDSQIATPSLSKKVVKEKNIILPKENKEKIEMPKPDLSPSNEMGTENLNLEKKSVSPRKSVAPKQKSPPQDLKN